MPLHATCLSYSAVHYLAQGYLAIANTRLYRSVRAFPFPRTHAFTRTRMQYFNDARRGPARASGTDDASTHCRTGDESVNLPSSICWPIPAYPEMFPQKDNRASRDEVRPSIHLRIYLSARGLARGFGLGVRS